MINHHSATYSKLTAPWVRRDQRCHVSESIQVFVSRRAVVARTCRSDTRVVERGSWYCAYTPVGSGDR